MLILPEELRRYCGDRPELEHEGGTIDEVLQEACNQFTQLRSRLFNDDGELHAHFIVLHRGQPLNRDQMGQVTVTPEDTIEVYLIASGG